MGWAAGRKLRRAVDGLSRVVAIELLSAARALDLRVAALGVSPAPATAAVVDRLRADIPGPGPDRYLAPDIDAAHALVVGGELLAAARQATLTATTTPALTTGADR
jgi:histidine ammonia-lyase